MGFDTIEINLVQYFFGSNTFRPKVFGHELFLDQNFLDLIFFRQKQ